MPLAKADHTEGVEVAEPTDVEASETVDALEESFLLRLPGVLISLSMPTKDDNRGSKEGSSSAKLLVTHQPGSSSCRQTSRSHTNRSHFSRSCPKLLSSGSFMLTQPLCSLAFLDAVKPSLRYKLAAAQFLSATSKCRSLHLKCGHLVSVCCKALASRSVATPRFWWCRLTLMWDITIWPTLAAALSLPRVGYRCLSASASSSSSLSPWQTRK
mmetsp:Transcript_28721/g.89314  ORF Transcript_28721/g.89314 Transcript_28721/m.89314 type:complete len:213 (+) Transcript_28721:381-1019(+)